MSAAFPTFRPRAPWFGADLQTLRNVLRGPVINPSGRNATEIVLPLDDGTGDALVGALDQPSSALGGKELVVLIHGLSGSADSAYILASASAWLERGHPVLRLNLRGAGASRQYCRLQYHAGRTDDLRNALRAVGPDALRNGLILVGYSLGGNMLLKFLAEYGRDLPILAAASVSAPIDLSAASQRFLALRNRPYHRHLLATMKLECFGGRSEISEPERSAVEAAQTIYDFDENFVAPRNGYRDAEHYYAENHARQFLDEIRVPTLVIHALDDPWIPATSYTSHEWHANPRVHPLLAPGGGHVGFHGQGARLPWHDRCIGIFVDHVKSGGDP